jgi:hypothetical protein
MLILARMGSRGLSNSAHRNAAGPTAHTICAANATRKVNTHLQV